MDDSWTKRKVGTIEIEHLSTAHIVKLTINAEEEVRQGVFEIVEQEIWMDYETFSDLRKAILLT